MDAARSKLECDDVRWCDARDMDIQTFWQLVEHLQERDREIEAEIVELEEST